MTWCDAQKDFPVLERAISRLNTMAGQGEKRVIRTARGAELKEPDEVPLAVFSDGLLLWRGPFRPWTDLGTQQFVQVRSPKDRRYFACGHGFYY